MSKNESEKMLEILGNLSDDELKEMLSAQEQLEKQLNENGPQNDDELHEWLIYELGIDVPRTAVCENHVAPFTFLADLYFDRVDAALAVANRGGSKTFLVAVLHWINARFKPGIESCTFGAIEAQSFRAYAHLKHWVFDDKGNKKPEIVSSLMRETVFANGSKIEVLGSTPEAVNGPHPQIAHADEIELMRDDTWLESQPLDTLIPTPTGHKAMGDLRLGDFVYGRDGMPTKVIKVMDYGERDVYRVTLTDGRSTECCADHLWTVAGGSQRRRGVWKTVRTSEMIENGTKIIGQYRYGVPANQPVEFSYSELPIHPYVLGVLLGDGYLGKNIAFRSVDDHIVQRVDSFLDEYRVSSCVAGKYANHNIVRSGSDRTFKSVIDSIGLESKKSHDKFIPDLYKFSSAKDRLEIIRGLMDTDGCAMQDNCVGQYATVSKQLALDLREIVFSLGGRAILRQKNFNSEWSKGILYTLDISFVDFTMPFTLPRKVEKMAMRQRTLDPSIKSIKPSRKTKVRCIGVDNADSTYLTNDFIVTHNSRNMTISKKIKNGTIASPQDIATSTRKGPSGRVQELIDEIEKAIAEGYKPPRKLYIWCIKETASQQKNCQIANPDLAEEIRCPCDNIRKGEWEDGSPRLLRDVCNGDFYKSRGWQPYSDLVKQFTENDRVTFEVQQLCAKPEMHHHYVSQWRDDRHCIRNFEVDPANGPIFLSVDWGGCYDEQTEVLTDRGWIPFPEIAEEDKFASLNIETHKVIFQKPEAVVKKEYGGVMERYENRSVDLLVSADHNMLVAPLRGKGRDDWRIIRSDSIGERGDGLRVTRTSKGREDAVLAPFVLSGITAADGRVLPDVIIDPEDWAALLGFWMAEGHTHLGKNKHGERRQSGDVGFTHYNRENITQIKRIAGRYFKVLDHISYEPKRGQLKICDPRLYAYFAQFGKAGEKFLPDDMKQWDASLLKIYLDWHMRGDGHIDNDGERDHSKRIYTGSKQLADDLQEITMYAGSAATISMREPRDSIIDGRKINARLPQYIVSFIEKRLEPQIASKPLQKPVKSEVNSAEWNMGKVYCVHLPEHHTVYVRRNGKPVWSGNTNPHAVNWYQLLAFEADVEIWNHPEDKIITRRLKEGTLVCFGEIYISEIGNEQLGKLVQEREKRWAIKHNSFRVYERFADPQGKAARMDWKAMGLPTKWHATREFDEHIKSVRSMFDDDLFVVDGEACPMFVREIKAWRADPRTGSQIDKFNHCLPAGTIVNTVDGDISIEDVQVGQFVNTVFGPHQVTAAGITRFNQDVYEIELADGTSLKSTGDHPWWIEGKGWVDTSDIRYNDQVWKLSQEAKQKSSNSEEFGFGVTQKPKMNHLASTTDLGFKKLISGLSLYTEKSGKQKMAIFQRAATYITQTLTRSTTMLKILFVLPEKNTLRFIKVNRAARKEKIISIRLGQKITQKIFSIQKLESKPRLEIENITNRLSKTHSKSRAFGVQMSLETLLRLEEQDSVQMPANLHTEGRLALMTKSGIASDAEANLSATNTFPENIVLVPVVSVRKVSNETVYDLTVDGAHEFFADSVRSSNCMSNFRYAVANIKKIKQRALSISGNLPAAKTIPRQATISKTGSAGPTPVGFKGQTDDYDNWRKSLGEPVTRVKK